MGAGPGRGRTNSWIPPLLLVLVLAALSPAVVTLPGPLRLSYGLTYAYLGFAVTTVFLVRRVTTRPGPWLGRRFVRRVLVLLALLACLVMVAAPGGLGGTAVLLVLWLALCNVLLGRATQQITAASTARLDERQRTLRDRAYSSAYLLLAGAIGVVVLVTYLATAATRAWLASAIDGGPIVVVVALLICLPTLVVAWTEPAAHTPAPRSSRSHLLVVGLAMAMVGISLAAPLASAAGVLLLPARETALTKTPVPPLTGAGCANYQRTAEVGVWFSAALPLRAQICWNGQRARYLWGLNRSDCLNYDSILVTVTEATCSRHTSADGTLEFTYAAWVQPEVLAFLRRRLVVTLAVDRRGQQVALR